MACIASIQFQHVKTLGFFIKEKVTEHIIKLTKF